MKGQSYKSHFLISLLFACVSVTHAQYINTTAGNGKSGYLGDGGLAIYAELSYPFGIAVDDSNSIYISDTDNNCIRKVNSNGIISTFAGNGTSGYSGDGGPATNAKMWLPFGVITGRSGNVYISDNNQRIREINTAGIISTIAGNGTPGFSGDGGQATAAELYNPAGVAVDTVGNIYVVDHDNNRVRKIATNGIISTFAGNGALGYSGDGGPATNAKLCAPTGIAVDDSGNIYIADTDNDRIRKVSPTGTITTVAGNGYGSPSSGGFAGDGGPATLAELFEPFGVAVDDSGNVFITDDINNRIRKVNTTGIISTIAGIGSGGYFGDGGLATAAELNNPTGVAIDVLGSVYISDYGNTRIRKLSTEDISGLNEIQQDKIVQLYPNPSSGKFTIVLNIENKNSIIEVYDVLGEKMYQGTLTSTTSQINLSGKPSGLYLYRILSEKGDLISTGKLIIQ